MAKYWDTRGGAREGSGRPEIGTARALRITLPDSDWEKIDELINDGHVKNQSEYFRVLHQAQFKKLKI